MKTGFTGRIFECIGLKEQEDAILWSQWFKIGKRYKESKPFMIIGKGKPPEHLLLFLSEDEEPWYVNVDQFKLVKDE